MPVHVEAQDNKIFVKCEECRESEQLTGHAHYQGGYRIALFNLFYAFSFTWILSFFSVFNYACFAEM